MSEKETFDDASSTTTAFSEDIDGIFLKSKLINAFPDASQLPHLRITDGKTLIAYVAYALSDNIFVYATTRAYYPGEAVIRWSAHGVKNAFDNTVLATLMDTRSGAATAIQGAISKGSKISAFCSSGAVSSMLPQLYDLAENPASITIHIAAQNSGENLTNYADYNSILAARDTGLGWINSYTVQEAQDIALIAHLVSASLKYPFLHVFDGVRTANEFSTVDILTLSNIKDLFVESAEMTEFSNQTILETIEKVSDRFEKVTGRKYKLFEYVGADDADIVVVVIGEEATIIKETVSGLSNSGLKFGVIIPRVYRPWSEQHFIAALPQTVKVVAVLEQDGLENSLSADVSLSIQSGYWNTRKPIIVHSKYPTDLKFTGNVVTAILEQLNTNHIVDFTSIPENVAIAHSTFSNTTQYIFWDSEVAGTVEAARHIAEIASQNENVTVRLLSNYDLYNNGGVITTLLQLGPKNINTSHLVHYPVDYISIHDFRLVAKYDILASLKDQGRVLINTTFTLDELDTKLPNDFRLELARRNIHLYIINANDIVKESGLPFNLINVIFQIAYFVINTEIVSHGLEDIILQSYNSDSKDINKKIHTLIDQTRQNLTRVVLPPTWLILEKSNSVLPLFPLSNSYGPNFDKPEVKKPVLSKWHMAARNLSFKEATQETKSIRPDLPEVNYIIKVAENKRLTPSDYDRNVFHIEFDIAGTNLRYEIGDALGVHGHNDHGEVLAFLTSCGLDPNELINIPSKDDSGIAEVRTALQVFTQNLDVFGRPPKRFYEFMAEYATDNIETEKLHWIVSSEGAVELKRRIQETYTYADLLQEFPSVRPPIEELVQAISPIKPRHYSIASSQNMHPDSVHLLVVTVEWETSLGKKRFGHCTRYLAHLKVGDHVTVSIKPSVMRLPPLHSQPVIMAGLGTGMAPFRAFIEERAYRKSLGHEIGSMTLYFGSRHRSMEYLYGEELEAYHRAGILTHLQLAFSRDGPRKVYIQHKMKEDAQHLHRTLVEENGHFYLCGPTWPVPDVRDAIIYGIKEHGGASESEAADWINKLKDLERYVLEVY